MARDEIGELVDIDKMVDMDGRVCSAVEQTGADGHAGTEFRFRQAADMVWGRYSGGSIRMGFLVGTSDGRTLDLRCTQLTTDGATATGHTVDRIERLDDGRVRLHRTWSWDSQPGGGSGMLEEVLRS